MTDLNAAFALNGPEDCARLYAAWAASYDAEFAAEMDYRLPAHVAAAFLAHGGSGPVLDVGAGTGLLAGHLRNMGFAGAIDAVDLSVDMLDSARAKGLYRHLHRADITRPLALTGPYSGVVSSGTFTHGHVGPEAIVQLERQAARGALFAVSINEGVYRSMGFDAALSERPGVTFLDVQIYGPAAAAKDPDHAAQRGLIAIWRHGVHDGAAG
ncbi:MAG: class I SAM-dependent methyltransferase [Pseudotabrizicola sp.]|uniref:class I SAM-dependent DNA methyltransferase n=1 Tax=Pseudotabrizicola sp. TaxID=2939647 RepID=UPI002716724D|nr:class I SAM-dependent methyltransferase [Pseudotabrizicola sp.]MDO8882191.1 class I SAM-dependent methyltransferase [Pseudotabrizicola sp.]MDP2083280.1 class I SAM-dependent methyltransferase [Pseudotabrizicola sp.]MDZ7575917.1 class I SAM-dependent methyltransferase [Pseudotabrizicola sp.]